MQKILSKQKSDKDSCDSSVCLYPTALNFTTTYITSKNHLSVLPPPQFFFFLFLNPKPYLAKEFVIAFHGLQSFILLSLSRVLLVGMDWTWKTQFFFIFFLLLFCLSTMPYQHRLIQLSNKQQMMVAFSSPARITERMFDHSFPSCAFFFS